MRRLLLGCAVLVASISGLEAQDRSNATRIGVLAPGSEASMRGYLQGLRQGLADLGLIDGQNIQLNIQYANGKIERLNSIAVEFARSGADIIFTGGDQAASAAKRATDKVPIVAVACDALAAGLVTNLARPGENITGITCINADLAAKRIELFKDAIPSLSRIGVVLNPSDRRMVSELGESEDAAKAHMISLQELDVTKPEEIEIAFARAAESGLGGVAVIFDSMTFFNRAKLAETAARNQIPTIFNFREYVDAGGLLSYGPNLRDMYRQSARHILKIIQGESPGDIPMEQPTRFELVINLKTAKMLGLTMPPTLIARTDDVIE
jgi:putative tryptophan/tyrosine transport system substrate-binding protein